VILEKRRSIKKNPRIENMSEVRRAKISELAKGGSESTKYRKFGRPRRNEVQEGSRSGYLIKASREAQIRITLWRGHLGS